MTLLLPDHKEQLSTWEISFLKFSAWTDLGRDGEKLQKIHSEGYGEFPEALAEVYIHWRVLGADGKMIEQRNLRLSREPSQSKG